MQKYPLNEITYSVRASQAVIQYGVGAMVDFPDQTLMTAAPEYWKDEITVIHDERLEKMLHVDYFGIPGRSDGNNSGMGISYVRFPEWYFCPKCRKFQPLSAWFKEYKMKDKKRLEKDPYMVKHLQCPDCRQDLVVTRIITVCEHGHIDDFPWIKWVHSRNLGGPKVICNNPRLTFKTGASAAEGLEGLEVTCETCGARATLKDAFNPDIFRILQKKTGWDFTCTGRHPWKHAHEDCTEFPKATQRGSSSVYYPVVASSIVIPPYSGILTEKIEKNGTYNEFKTEIKTISSLSILSDEMKNGLINERIDTAAVKISKQIGADPLQVKSILLRKLEDSSDTEENTFSSKYKYEEYCALSGKVSAINGEDGDFEREATNIEDYDLPYVKQISLINKVREVQALTGFTRVHPAERNEKKITKDNIISVKEDPNTEWYPAYQVKGEGIFIEFSHDAIEEWIRNNPEIINRVERLNTKYRESYMGQYTVRTISAKFLLLHTISHLLIKRLSFECGYSIASLRERIYCDRDGDSDKMSGIFIYTASGDSEGTLGGLVRQGRSDTFPKIFRRAMIEAKTCSNDPVCSLSTGQGRDSLNLAACYSCTLIPETSCEEFNIFLDRCSVVGTLDRPEIGFYSNQVLGSEEWHCTEKTDERKTNERIIQTSKPVFQITDYGIDYENESYNKIWGDVFAWANDKEAVLLNQLQNNTSLFTNKEKPHAKCKFTVGSDQKEYNCDLVWKESKVALFTESYEDSYTEAVKTDWNCFYSCDPAFDIDLLAAKITRK